jgi:hypothetical protein
MLMLLSSCTIDCTVLPSKFPTWSPDKDLLIFSLPFHWHYDRNQNLRIYYCPTALLSLTVVSSTFCTICDFSSLFLTSFFWKSVSHFWNAINQFFSCREYSSHVLLLVIVYHSEPDKIKHFTKSVNRFSFNSLPHFTLVITNFDRILTFKRSRSYSERNSRPNH